MVNAARALETADPRLRPAAVSSLETAAIAWASNHEI
jgi:hypothetical protein